MKGKIVKIGKRLFYASEKADWEVVDITLPATLKESVFERKKIFVREEIDENLSFLCKLSTTSPMSYPNPHTTVFLLSPLRNCGDGDNIERIEFTWEKDYISFSVKRTSVLTGKDFFIDALVNIAVYVLRNSADYDELMLYKKLMHSQIPVSLDLMTAFKNYILKTVNKSLKDPIPHFLRIDITKVGTRGLDTTLNNLTPEMTQPFNPFLP